MYFQFIDNITWFFNIRPSLTWDANITSLLTWEICLWDCIGWGLIQVWYWKSHVKCNLSWTWNRRGKKVSDMQPCPILISSQVTDPEKSSLRVLHVNCKWNMWIVHLYNQSTFSRQVSMYDYYIFTYYTQEKHLCQIYKSNFSYLTVMYVK